MRFSVIIPAFNEEKILRGSLEKIISFLGPKSPEYEIIVVDDGSTDGTSATIEKYIVSKEINLVRYENNRGKGFAVRAGVEKAEGEYILFSDADLSTPIEEAEKLLRETEQKNFDIAIASRALKESQIDVRQPIYRELMGKIFNKIARIFTFSGIYDSQCGFKLFRKTAAKRLFSISRINGFAFDVEIIFLAQKFGYSITELPVRWLNNPNTKVSALSDSLKMFFDVIKIRINYLRGLYV